MKKPSNEFCYHYKQLKIGTFLLRWQGDVPIICVELSLQLSIQNFSRSQNTLTISEVLIVARNKNRAG